MATNFFTQFRQSTTPDTRGGMAAMAQAAAAEQAALKGIGGSILGHVDRLNAEEDRKAKLAQQELANKRADAQLGIQQSQLAIQQAKEADRVKALKDKALYDKTVSDLLSGITDTKDVKSTVTNTVVTKPGVKGVIGNEDKVAEINNLNAFNEIRKAALQAGDFEPIDNITSDVPISTVPTTVSAEHQNRSNTLRNLVNNDGYTGRAESDTTGKRMANILQVPNAVDTIGSFLGDAVNNFTGTQIFGSKNKVDSPTTKAVMEDGFDTDPKAPVAVVAPSDPKPAADLKALKDKFIEDEVAKITMNRLDAPELIKSKAAIPAETKKVTKEIIKQVKLKPEEQLSNLRNSILSSNLPGSYKMDVMSNIDKMFPKGKQMTVGEQIQLAKLNNDIAKQNAAALKEVSTIEGIKSMYPGMPANVKTLDGAKMWAKKIDKSKEGKTPFVGSLYDSLTTKDSGDVAALDKWVTKNATYLNNLTTTQKNSLLARMKAGYMHESENDLSDYLGGSAFGDMIDSLGITELK